MSKVREPTAVVPVYEFIVQTHGKIPDVGEEQPVLGLVEEKVHKGLVLELFEPDLLRGMLEQFLQAVEAVERVTPRAFEGSPADSPQILRGDRPVVDLKLRAQALLELPLPAGPRLVVSFAEPAHEVVAVAAL
jgi:hypothetical protein